MRCLQEKVVPELRFTPPGDPRTQGTNTARAFKVESAYRPQPYQDHLYEIYSKRKQLINRKRYGKECDSLRQTLDAQKRNHSLGGIVAQTNSHHSSGTGFDMSIQGASQGQISAWAKDCGLGRLIGIRGEETHFFLK
ncbi:MAG: hypothetical protein IPN69_09750 [Acidobacteria bacterium]|nr:hypothetical protein [Acidobacteriota bacterium]